MLVFDTTVVQNGAALDRLEVSERYEAVTSPLLSYRYLPSLYEENRFFNVVIASESSERI